MADEITRERRLSLALNSEVAGVVVDLDTGDSIELAELEDEDLARALVKAKALGERLATRQLELELEQLRRMDRAAAWTAKPAPGIQLTGASPKTAVDYDARRLREELDALVDAGTIGEEARDAAVREETPKPALKVRIRGVDALRKLGIDEVDEAIAAAQKSKRRRVKIETKPVRPPAIDGKGQEKAA